MLDFDLLSYFSLSQAGFLAQGFCTHAPLLPQGCKLSPCCPSCHKQVLFMRALWCDGRSCVHHPCQRIFKQHARSAEAWPLLRNHPQHLWGHFWGYGKMLFWVSCSSNHQSNRTGRKDRQTLLLKLPENKIGKNMASWSPLIPQRHKRLRLCSIHVDLDWQ